MSKLLRQAEAVSWTVGTGTSPSPTILALLERLNEQRKKSLRLAKRRAARGQS